MNGIIAAAFWTSVLIAPNGPLSDNFVKNEVTSQNNYHISNVLFQKETVGYEIGYSYSPKVALGPLQPIYYVSITDKSATWLGAGYVNKLNLNDDFFVPTKSNQYALAASSIL